MTGNDARPIRAADGLPETGKKARFWTRWVIANGLGELVGLGFAAAAAALVVETAGPPSRPAPVIAFATLLVLLGAIEGAVVGWAQARVLRERIPRPHGWIEATVAGALVAWTLGMLPSTIMNLLEPTSSSPPPEPPVWLTLVLAAGLGLVAGPILALFQVRVLGRYVGRAGWWVLANALAWAVGMPIIFAGIDLVEGFSRVPAATVVVACTLLLAGIAVGAIHGLFLVRLTSSLQGETGRRAAASP